MAAGRPQVVDMDAQGGRAVAPGDIRVCKANAESLREEAPHVGAHGPSLLDTLPLFSKCGE